jgi:uncharacterized protein (DUF983 family)
MKVTRLQAIGRGLAGRCPNCGEPTLFAPGRLFTVNETCRVCGLKLDRGEGTFLGPFVLNYAVAAFGVVIPLIILHARGHLGGGATIGLCAGGALLVPLLLYRASWGWWLALYYAFLPDSLPANLGGRPEDDE